jgi:hypothetical protein
MESERDNLKGNHKFIRKADPMELSAGRLIEWEEGDKRT